MSPKRSCAAIALFAALGSAPASAELPAVEVEERLHALEHVFEAAEVVSGPRAVECRLSGGASTTCFSITVRPQPGERTPGPWCPDDVADGPDKSGVWFDSDRLIDADGKFLADLAEFYDDPQWHIVDPETGAVNVTRTRAACAAAARPDVDPQYRNHCVQCLPEYMPEDATVTYVIPLEPVAAGSPSPIRGGAVGIALDGVRLDGPAPVGAILDAHTIAPLDDCGGHVNLHVGYHYHAATNCLDPSGTREEGHDDAPVIGIAMDGHVIRRRELADGSVPADLDACGGHAPDGGQYHYHAGAPGMNRILGCLTGQHGCSSPEPGMACDATRPSPRP